MDSRYNLHYVKYNKTTPTNHLRVFLLLFCITTSNIIHSQKLTLPSDSVIVSGIRSHYNSKKHADILEYHVKSPPRWHNYIPSIGLTSSFNGSSIGIGPTVSFNISKLVSDKKKQYAIEAKIRAIEAKSTLDREKETRHAINLKKRIIIRNTELEKLQKILEIKRKIFSYDSSKFANQEILPDAYYRSQIDILSQEHQVIKAQQMIDLEILKLYQEAYLDDR